MQQLIKGTDGPGKPTIRQWWKLYNINSSWDEVKTSTINLGWNKVWPECTHDFPGFAEDDIKPDKASQEAEKEGDEEESVRGLDIKSL
ncbi:hypothetical protein E2C01_045306 [Portunus trituberculatus]|uniref:Uncharacterized protein n=1 Tax=Portunus trituberculatus TaxID=210409 RepID=A0A5B7FUM0_PORTR|nr:hypothetical protein [Portunus trituberculatus]